MIRTLGPAKEIRGAVRLPPNPDLVVLSVVTAAVSETTLVIPHVPSTPFLDRWEKTLAALGKIARHGDLLQFVPYPRNTTPVLLPSTSLYARDYIILALLGSGRHVVLETPHNAWVEVWQATARHARCDLTVQTNDSGHMLLSLAQRPDTSIPEANIAPDRLMGMLGLALGLRRPVRTTVTYPVSTPLRHLLPLLGYTFDIRNAAERASDPIAKRILRMKGKPLTLGDSTSYVVTADFSVAPRPEVEVELPGDDVLGAIMIAAKSLIQRGNLVIENMPLESWNTPTLQLVRRMGANPAVQATTESSFGQCGLVQLQRFSPAGRKVECTPLYQYELQLPSMVVAALFAEGESVFRGLTELRGGPESALDAVAGFLEALDAHAGRLVPDGIVLRGKAQYDGFDLAGTFAAHIAAAWAVAALKCIGKSSLDDSRIVERWPDFFTILDSVCEYRN